MIISSIFHPAVISTSLISSVLFICWFQFWTKKAKIARTEKERAYVCTLLSSSITSTCSLPLVIELVTTRDLSQVMIYRTWTTLSTTFFLTFLIMDLCLGMIYYRNKIGLLTGWIHHLTYILVLIWAISNQLCSIFMMMCILEVPTFLLALGSIRVRLRRDALFAASFVLTRILFHAYAIKCAWNMELGFGRVVNALVAFFPVHCYWFLGFIKQQLRLRSKQKVIQLTNDNDVVQQEIKKEVAVLSSNSKQQQLQQKKKKNRKHYLNYTTAIYQSTPISVH